MADFHEHRFPQIPHFSLTFLSRDHKKKLKFQHGDKVCVTKNAFIDLEGAETPKKRHGDGAEKMGTQRNPDGDDEKQAKARLCNGEIFFITQVSDQSTKVNSLPAVQCHFLSQLEKKMLESLMNVRLQIPNKEGGERGEREVCEERGR